MPSSSIFSPISGLGTNKSGFNKSNNLISKEEYTSLIQETRKQIDLTLQNIREGNFVIAPKFTSEYDSPCASCEAKDICYKDYKDNVYIKLKKENEKEEK